MKFPRHPRDLTLDRVTKDRESSSKEGLCSALSTLLLHKIMIKKLCGSTLIVFLVKINWSVAYNSM